MNINEVKHIIKNDPRYDFLRKNKYILVSLGGSWAYGTNNDQSDIDVRGVMFEPLNSIIGLASFEQLEMHNEEYGVDCVIYGLKKMTNLLLGNNPNCIEILSPQERNVVYTSDIGKLLIEHRHDFLCKSAAFKFNAYANAQLNRIENALCHDSLPPIQKEEHIMRSINGMIAHFNERFRSFENGSVVARVANVDESNLEKEIVLDINLDGYPLRDYKGIWSEMNNTLKDYSKLNGRNRKKDIPHICKHMMHLVRLCLMGIDILDKEEIITYRENDIDLLMAIRNGEFITADGLIKQDFYKLVESIKVQFDHSLNNTKLPDKPNYNEVEKFVIQAYRKYLEEENSIYEQNI